MRYLVVMSGHVVLEAAGFQLIVFAIPPQIAGSIRIDTPDPDEKVWEFQGWRVCDGHDPEGNVIQVREQAMEGN